MTDSCFSYRIVSIPTVQRRFTTHTFLHRQCKIVSRCRPRFHHTIVLIIGVPTRPIPSLLCPPSEHDMKDASSSLPLPFPRACPLHPIKPIKAVEISPGFDSPSLTSSPNSEAPVKKEELARAQGVTGGNERRELCLQNSQLSPAAP